MENLILDHCIRSDNQIRFNVEKVEDTGLFNLITITHEDSGQSEELFGFKSETFNIGQNYLSMKLHFVVPINGQIKSSPFVAKCSADQFKSEDVNHLSKENQTQITPALYMTESAHNLFRVNNLLDEFGHSCSPNSIAVDQNQNLTYFQYNNLYHIPYWGFNDQGDVVQVTGSKLFTFSYVCDENDFKRFQDRVNRGEITYYTPIKFDDYPELIDKSMNWWVHRVYDLVTFPV